MSAAYQSPLRMLRGYRFSSTFARANSFDDAYSKLYCHNIDVRRPFCPYDLHGACKDSQCPYQHASAMSMDNAQRTEHFCSYAPSLLALSSTQGATQREALKKLKLYAAKFMASHLNRMSIRDYFKYLYDHVAAAMQQQAPCGTTVLTRIPALVISNNKSLGTAADNDPMWRSIETAETTSAADSSSIACPVVHLLDKIIGVNMTRSCHVKLRHLAAHDRLHIDYLRAQHERLALISSPSSDNTTTTSVSSSSLDLDADELCVAWLFLAKQTFVASVAAAASVTGSVDEQQQPVDKLLNVLSHALESQPDSELTWLVYLRVYSAWKRNATVDYHEICLLAMDNLVTYDLVWLMLNTCVRSSSSSSSSSSATYVAVFERLERYLLAVDSERSLAAEFEQREGGASLTTRVSFYLMEMVVYHVYLTLSLDNGQGNEESVALFRRYLGNARLTDRLEPSDLCLLWLCLIHLVAFGYLPTWLRVSRALKSRTLDALAQPAFWLLSTQQQQQQQQGRRRRRREYNKRLFEALDSIYGTRDTEAAATPRRTFDMFLLPWNVNNSSNNSKQQQQQQPVGVVAAKHVVSTAASTSYSIERAQNLFHEALKAVNARCSSSGAQREATRLASLPLFVNLIHLEVSNRRHETAGKLCQRLLQSPEAGSFKELWLSLIYIKASHQTPPPPPPQQQQQQQQDVTSDEACCHQALAKFPYDPHLTLLCAQHLHSIVSYHLKASSSSSILYIHFFNLSIFSL